VPQGYWPENVRFIESGADLTQPYLGFQNIALGCGHLDVPPGLHERELAERFPEVYAQRGREKALAAPDGWLLNTRHLYVRKPAIPVEHYATTWVVDRAVDFIESTDGPFFAWCGIPDPHHPFKPPGEYWHKFAPEDEPPPVRQEGELDDRPPHFQGFWEGRYEGVNTDGFLTGSRHLTDERLRIIQAAYYGMVTMIDDGVARLLAALRAGGCEWNTVVIFVSDHGEYLGDHRLILKGPMHYESLLRVPFVLRCPGLVQAGRSIEGLAALIDLFPTILELAGVRVPEGAQGTSLVPQLVGESDRAQDEVYIENDVDPLGLRLRTLVDERYRITCYSGEDYGEIYDLESDPNEFVNLWERGGTALKGELTARLLDAVVRNQDRLPPKGAHA